MTTLLKSFLGNESGATAIEYGLIAVLIAIAAVAAMRTIGSRTNNTFTNVANNLTR